MRATVAGLSSLVLCGGCSLLIEAERGELSADAGQSGGGRDSAPVEFECPDPLSPLDIAPLVEFCFADDQYRDFSGDRLTETRGLTTELEVYIDGLPGTLAVSDRALVFPDVEFGSVAVGDDFSLAQECVEETELVVEVVVEHAAEQIFMADTNTLRWFEVRRPGQDLNLLMGTNGDGDQLRIQSDVDGDEERASIPSTLSRRVDHVVLTFDSTTWRGYVNGELLVDGANFGPITDWSDTIDPVNLPQLALGNRVYDGGATDGSWRGRLYFFGWYCGFLSTAQVGQRAALFAPLAD